jgi:pimeloyl-ACP methyl ester carboxylesterase
MKISTVPITLYRASNGPLRSADLVFVHGLMGSLQTWSSSPERTFWPSWLSEHGNVWILNYPADAFWWASSGASMAFPERARSIIDLLVNHQLGRRPLVFVTHSLGGVLVKGMLRAANDLNEPNWKRLLQNTRGVAFLGTPHTGAALGTLADALRLLGTTINAAQLRSNEPHLLDLAAWYSRNAMRLGIRSLAYYEKGTVKGLKIVDEGSADPRVEDCNPVPSDANHIDICKPQSNSDPVYLGVLRFVESLIGSPNSQLSGADTSRCDRHNGNAVKYNIDTVFGIHRGDTCHYVQRDKVDNTFVGNLIGGKHLCIYGSSKQGKTALRKKHISAAEELAVVCDRTWASVDVFAAILKAANCLVQKNLNDPAPGASTIRMPAGQTVSVDLNHTADFLRVLESCFTGKYIVIEELHYLAESVQRDIAFKLKAVHELSDRYVFIVIGVWLEHNRLVHLNKDLQGRVAPINADEWTDDDLLRVIREGEEKLNIRFPAGFAEKLVERACGSVYLVREACYRACEIVEIYNRAEPVRVIEQSVNAAMILREIGNVGADYAGQIISLIELQNIPLYEHEKQAGLKDWVLRTLVCVSPKDLRKGISLKRLRALVRLKHPQSYHPTEGQIERVIKGAQSAQLAKSGHSLFDYDRREKIIRCVDKGFILWRSGTTPEKIEQLIFDGEIPTGQEEFPSKRVYPAVLSIRRNDQQQRRGHA